MTEKMVETNEELVDVVLQWLFTGFTSTLAVRQIGKTSTPMMFVKAPQHEFPFKNIQRILWLKGSGKDVSVGNFESVGLWLEDKNTLFTSYSSPCPFNRYAKNGQLVHSSDVVDEIKAELAQRFYKAYSRRFPDTDSFSTDVSVLNTNGLGIHEYFHSLMEWRYLNNNLEKSGKDFFVKSKKTLAAIDVFDTNDALAYVLGNKREFLMQAMKKLSAEKINSMLEELRLSYLWETDVQAYTPSKRAQCAKLLADAINNYKIDKTERKERQKFSEWVDEVNFVSFDVLYEGDDGKEYNVITYRPFLNDPHLLYDKVTLYIAMDNEFMLSGKDGEKVPCMVENIKRVSKSGHTIYERPEF